ncbi:MAG: hypothetical protein ACTS3R_16190 [Inquilinaceae bacterium]
MTGAQPLLRRIGRRLWRVLWTGSLLAATLSLLVGLPVLHYAPDCQFRPMRSPMTHAFMAELVSYFHDFGFDYVYMGGDVFIRDPDLLWWVFSRVAEPNGIILENDGQTLLDSQLSNAQTKALMRVLYSTTSPLPPEDPVRVFLKAVDDQDEFDFCTLKRHLAIRSPDETWR